MVVYIVLPTIIFSKIVRLCCLRVYIDVPSSLDKVGYIMSLLYIAFCNSSRSFSICNII